MALCISYLSFDATEVNILYTGLKVTIFNTGVDSLSFSFEKISSYVGETGKMNRSSDFCRRFAECDC